MKIPAAVTVNTEAISSGLTVTEDVCLPEADVPKVFDYDVYVGGIASTAPRWTELQALSRKTSLPAEITLEADGYLYFGLPLGTEPLGLLVDEQTETLADVEIPGVPNYPDNLVTYVFRRTAEALAAGTYTVDVITAQEAEA